MALNRDPSQAVEVYVQIIGGEEHASLLALMSSILEVHPCINKIQTTLKWYGIIHMILEETIKLMWVVAI
ncbi:unnamed protein product [Sphagnum jensenii]|uniref:Uncharacterized protein n=1 Tax=Sphagnum jensenii TaxID=128206 RepID=A0ABP0WYZ9_9BRYO